MDLNPAQIHRACGVLLGMAAGDALGAGYEFGPPMPATADVVMKGGGAFDWEPGEWTDDTQMALVIAQAAVGGADLRHPEVVDAVAKGWYDWSLEATDVGHQTRKVLSRYGGSEGFPSASALHAESRALHEATGHTAGNGSLMRTAPVALAYLEDPEGLTEAAEALSSLTHFDPEAGEACVLWCHAIRHAVLTGELDVRIGLSQLHENRTDVWRKRLDDAEALSPSDFERNGWVVQALQGAWSAIASTRGVGERAADHLRAGLEAAVRGGRDTDTVAAIAGGLLGAAYGAAAIPATWRRVLHGWPGLRARDLIGLAAQIVHRGRLSIDEWPLAARVEYGTWPGSDFVAAHPADPGVLIGGAVVLDDLPEEVDAVVSLCRLGSAQAPAAGIAPEDHVEVWLIDSSWEGSNPHLEFVLEDTADVVAELRAEGKTVYLHCVRAESRTPTVAAMYAMRAHGQSAQEAFDSVVAVLPNAHPNSRFRQALGV